MAREAVIFDVDGTLCDVTSVRHHVLSRPKNFDAFHAGSIDCPPHQHVVEAARAHHEAERAVLVVTARRERWMYHTLFWLHDHGVPHEHLLMRGDRDARPDYEVKRDILAWIARQGYRVVEAWDDNPSVVALWQEHGIPVQVVPGWLTEEV